MEVKVPVSLNLNDAPQFYNTPGEIFLTENSSKTIKIDVVDVEGNSFTVKSKENYNHLNWTFADGVLTVTVSPAYGDEGTHNYVFVAEDEHGAVRENTINVTVGHTNQAPVYIGTDDAFRFHQTEGLTEFAIEDLFADPDEDSFTFTVTNGDPLLLKVFTSPEGILIKTLAAGTTNLVFTLTDSHGAVNVISREVSIDNASGIGNPVDRTAIIFPNPTTGKARVIFSGAMNGVSQIRVNSILGEIIQIIPNVATGQEIDLDMTTLPSGTYFIEVIMKNGKYTSKIIKE
jgi:hypothetical protein